MSLPQKAAPLLALRNEKSQLVALAERQLAGERAAIAFQAALRRRQADSNEAEAKPVSRLVKQCCTAGSDWKLLDRAHIAVPIVSPHWEF